MKDGRIWHGCQCGGEMASGFISVSAVGWDTYMYWECHSAYSVPRWPLSYQNFCVECRCSEVKICFLHGCSLKCHVHDMLRCFALGATCHVECGTGRHTALFTVGNCCAFACSGGALGGNLWAVCQRSGGGHIAYVASGQHGSDGQHGRTAVGCSEQCHSKCDAASEPKLGGCRWMPGKQRRVQHVGCSSAQFPRDG